MKKSLLNRLLSLAEGSVEGAQTRARASNQKSAVDLTQDPTRTFKSMRNLRNIYLNGGYISEGVDLFPIFAIGAGYELEIDEELLSGEADGQMEKELVQDFLERINFFDVQWQMSTDAETVRDGIAEIVYGRGQMNGVPVNVIPRPAECFEFVTDLTGNVVNYQQKYDNRGNVIQPVNLEPKQVLHYQFMSRPDSPYGVSIVERTLHDIKRDTKVAEAITAGICLHGTPKWHVKVNSVKPDAVSLSDTEWAELEDQFENFNAKDQFITEGDIVVEALDTAGVANVQLYSDVTLFRVCAGMGFPAELLGLRQGTTDATSVGRTNAFLRKIKIVQRDIESLWNLNIIDKITKRPGLIKLKLTDPNPEDFGKMATAISSLRTGVDPDAIIPADWARERLGIPEDEREDDEIPKKQELPFGVNPFMQQPQEKEMPEEDKKEIKGAQEDAEKELAAAAYELAAAVKTRRM